MIRRSYLLLLLLCSLALDGVSCLKNVRLELDPAAVEWGEEATLRCRYELDGAPLYSLKWYRGHHEFYRYSPSEQPPTKVFNFTWISVDTLKSNESQVTIRHVDFPLAGNFSCEVTTDAPSFSTASSSKVLSVVSLPKSKPSIFAERTRYEIGDTLRANCSAPPSKPPAVLSFTLNDQPVGEPSQQQADAKLERNSISDAQQQAQWRELTLQLQAFHYHSGQLKLRCTARIDGLYEQTSELRLGANSREPRPERVTSENAAQSIGVCCCLLVGLQLLVLVAAGLRFR